MTLQEFAQRLKTREQKKVFPFVALEQNVFFNNKV
jgi:hypothetical protein